MKIYVASSWRNKYYDEVVATLLNTFPYTYDFKKTDFHMSKVLGTDWVNADLEAYKEALQDPYAISSYAKDINALDSAGATVIVLPAGASAHLELGYAIAKDQFTAIYAPSQFEPELMYMDVKLITHNIVELVDKLEEYETSIWNSSKPISRKRYG